MLAATSSTGTLSSRVVHELALTERIVVAMILLIDNYDSFVYNLARYFERLGQETLVCRNDSIDVARVRRLAPQAVVLSPGPCTPKEAGISTDVVRELAGRVPLLGVCLGHQAIATAWGGEIERARLPMHGRTSAIQHDGKGIYAQLPNPLTVCRYHSLVVARRSLPACLEVSAETADGTIMSLRHRSQLCVGVQFHPEAILTHGGYLLLANFLTLAEIPHAAIPAGETEQVTPAGTVAELPQKPVTF